MLEGADEATPKVLTRLREGVPDVIDTPKELDLAIKRLGESSLHVAIDTERAQGFRYGSGAWLVQVRREDVGTYLIDSHALPNLHKLGEALDATWIFHAAGQDLPSLGELGLTPTTIFDTEIAARLVGTRSFSLTGVCETHLGVSLKKSHQSEDWSVRPLPTNWLRYAAMDVELLPALEEVLGNKLKEQGRRGWATQEFEYLRTHPHSPRENRWENLKGIGRLRKPRQWSFAKALWEAREQVAVELDLAPTRILSNRGIIEASMAEPDTRRKLQSLPEFRRPRARRYTDIWWDAVKSAKYLTAAEMPGSPNIRDEGTVPPLAQWRKMRPTAVPRLHVMRQLTAQSAQKLDLDADVVLEPRVQREVAWTPLNSKGEFEERLALAEARPWQRELLLEEFAQTPEPFSALSQKD